uniref:Carboxylesterase type B domain-containing protein n=1 Tax=Heliothis virescens TaxID=7102 RepID=A0A2A4JSD8_HELVI
MSVNLHLLSNYESLFHQAIIQSGPAVSPWMTRDVNNTVPLSLAEALEYNAESVADALNYLSTVDPHVIVKTAAELKLTETDNADNPLTLPCIEIYTEGVEHFMTEHPKNIKSTKVAKTPVIIGNNNNEMPFEYALQKDEFFEKYDFNNLISKDFEFGDNLEYALEDIRHFYIGDEKTSVHLQDQITDFASDFLINHPTQRMAERFLELGVEHFMTEHPKNIKSTKVAKTPLIIGNNNNEMPFEYALQKDEFFEKYDFNNLISKDFEFGDNLEYALEDIRHFYIGDEKTSVHLQDQITDFASDFLINHPTQRMAERFLELGAKAVYRYIFSYSGDRNLLKKAYNLDVRGAIHADELGYLFDMEILRGDISPEDQLMIDRLTTLWTNFAKYGNPTPETSDLLPEKWVPITKTTQPYLSLDADITMAARPFQEAMAFWDVFYKLHETQHKYYQDSEE